MGQYGWNVVHGLARTGRFRAITVLASGRASLNDRLPAASEVVTTRQVWARDDLRAAARLVRAILAERPDLVWFNLGFGVFGSSRAVNFLGLALPMLTRRAGIPTVVTLHEIFEAAHAQLYALGARNGPVTTWGARTATQMLLQADAVCVTLKRYLNELQTRYGARNVSHVPHGAFAPPELLPYPSQLSPREILYFGHFAPFKGLPVLVKAFELLKRVHPDAMLTLAGSDHLRFPGYLATLRAPVNGASGIRWLGPQPEAELRELFARARVVVMPYTAITGASSVLHRAAAFGRPVVASDLPDLRAVAEEENLLIEYAPPNDAAALATVLARLLSDPARQAAIAQHNFVMIQEMTLDHTCLRYIELFEQVVRRKT